MKIKKEQLVLFLNRNNVQHEFKIKAIYDYLLQQEIRYLYINPLVKFVIQTPKFNVKQLQMGFKSVLKRLLEQTEFSSNEVLLTKTAQFLWNHLKIGPTVIQLAREKKYLPEIKVEVPKTVETKVEVFKVEEELKDLDEETIRKNHERARKMREAKARKKAEREAAAQSKLDKLNT